MWCIIISFTSKPFLSSDFSAEKAMLLPKKIRKKIKENFVENLKSIFAKISSINYGCKCTHIKGNFKQKKRRSF
jgi:hypothetical protein